MAARLEVYLVEDSPILRRLFTASLAQAGVKVVGWSADAQKAIAELSMLRPDVIVVDISLASGSGLDVLRALRDSDWASSSLKVMLTNHVSSEYRELARRLGADRFFDKALETSEAMRFIASLAASRRASSRQERESETASAHS